MKCLVTLGGTREFIDPVRFISNVSTGRTGSAIAQGFIKNGWEVTVLAGAHSEIPDGCTSVSRFDGYQSLDLMLRDHLRRTPYDAVVHSAAVSDFSPTRFEVSKVESDSDSLVLELKKNPKIIDRLRVYSLNPKIVVVGFKYTHTSDPEKRLNAVESLLARNVCDFVVHNDGYLRANTGMHEFWTYTPKGFLHRSQNAHELGEFLVTLFASKKEGS